jgi:hypothetical protein
VYVEETVEKGIPDSLKKKHNADEQRAHKDGGDTSQEYLALVSSVGPPGVDDPDGYEHEGPKPSSGGHRRLLVFPTPLRIFDSVSDRAA